MKLAIDCDDVVVNYFGRVVECYNKEFAESLELSDITGWDDNPIKLSKHFGPNKQFENWWVWWSARAHLWGTCDIINGSIGGLYDLHAQGHYIQLVTSKPLWSRKAFLKWLARWDPYFDDLVIVEEGSGISKADVTDADLIIDDRPSTIIDWTNSGRPAIIFDRPWNQSPWMNGNKQIHPAKDQMVLRAKTWDDVMRAVGAVEHEWNPFLRGMVA